MPWKLFLANGEPDESGATDGNGKADDPSAQTKSSPCGAMVKADGTVVEFLDVGRDEKGDSSCPDQTDGERNEQQSSERRQQLDIGQ